ncbi:MAG: thiolase family protein [Gemmatimonadaceae bacterium]|nr:thiolase family protein [Gemmatimonadaceae bacterium]
MQMKDAVIVSAVRTAVARGKKDGGLATVHPVDLSAEVLKAVVQRVSLDPALVDDVLWGCAMPEGAQGLNVGRMAVLRAGFPVEVPAATVNRFCSSGLQTVAMAAQSIMTGLCDVVVAGGVEMMSVVPMGGHHTRLHPEMVEENIGMGFTAERVAARWAITREQADDFAFGSQQKAAAALQRGAFVNEIVPVPVPRVTWKGTKQSTEPTTFTVDELVRAETTREGLAKLKPAFAAKGVVTAGNSSPLSDGAAALLLMSADKAKELGLKPLARFVTFAVGGVAPDIMGVGPIKAVPKALAKSGLTLADLKMIELNEAFAVQGLAVMQELGMNAAVTNMNGGAIALGHPLGATGAKLTTQLVHALGSAGGGLGMVTMCIGGGMGAAGIFEVYAA